jgi:hypothetical protein
MLRFGSQARVVYAGQGGGCHSVAMTHFSAEAQIKTLTTAVENICGSSTNWP